MDASNLLKPALAQGALRCIGSTTYKEYRQYFEKDRALVRRFQKIDINEPSIPDAVEIMKGLKPYFEEFHKLRYTNDAVKAAVELSARYINDRKLPDKAIDVIDEIGRLANAAYREQAQIDDRGQGNRGNSRDNGANSPKTVSKDDAEVLKDLGQAQARRLRPGQGDRGIDIRDKTGTRGFARRRETDRKLSVLGADRGRQNRSRPSACRYVGRGACPLRHVGIYGAPHRVEADRRASGLCGLRPGRSFDRWMDQNPYCVLLLDEIEKAHPDLYNILFRSWTTGN